MTAQADPPANAGSATRRRWLGLFFIALGVAMIIVDATIVNVAVPQIIRDLGITSSDAQWVQEVYTLVFAALLLVVGRLADRYGRRLLFVTRRRLSSRRPVCLPPSPSPGRAAHRQPGAAGRRRRDDPADLAVPAQRRLPGPRPGHRLRGLGLHHRRHGRARAAARRVAHHLVLLAVGLRHQCPARPRCRRRAPCCSCRSPGRPPPARGNDLVGALLSVLGFGGIVFGLIQGRTYGWWTRTGDVQPRRARLDAGRSRPFRWPSPPVSPASRPSSPSSCAATRAGRVVAARPRAVLPSPRSATATSRR